MRDFDDHEIEYVRQISSISGVRYDIVKNVINSQVVHVAIALAQKGQATMFFGNVALKDGKLIFCKFSEYLKSVLSGKVRSKDVIEEMSSND